jgi:hypothetical protein
MTRHADAPRRRATDRRWEPMQMLSCVRVVDCVALSFTPIDQ